jgi:beta-phosphoglucomutase-like phosphatase (HAD superfamily)
LALIRDAAALDRHFEAMWAAQDNFGGKNHPKPLMSCANH